MLHDLEDDLETERFSPDLFIKDGKLTPDIQLEDSLTLAFGSDRHVCPDRHLSDSTLFMLFASVLHTFDI
ncbi:hypothetical protein QCA50_005213 [Cerrena zonata]|uniref:Cytochrome P450 n=1 Tax=Cerrena zonata TaxID=2478898 RepID=A0AAW0GRE1_9APHY